MKIQLKLSDALYDELELLAPEGETVEKFIEKRLPLLQRINPDRPYMYLNGDNIAALQALYGGKIFRSPEELIQTLQRTQTFRLPGAFELTLDMDVISQLQLQAEGMGVSFEKYMR